MKRARGPARSTQRLRLWLSRRCHEAEPEKCRHHFHVGGWQGSEMGDLLKRNSRPSKLGLDGGLVSSGTLSPAL
jgi:hypothetical protein